LGIGFEIPFQEIRKEKNFEDNKHDKKLHKDNKPNLPPPARHFAEACEIEDENLFDFLKHIQI